MIVEQRNDEPVSPERIEHEDGKVPVLHHDDGSTFIDVIPLRLGKLKLQIVVFFPDHTMANKTVNVNVEPSSTPPGSLSIFQGEPWIFIDLNEKKAPYRISPQAHYFGVSEVIPVYPRSFAKFTVKTRNDAPVIELDPETGRITPIGIGDALIETEYEGLLKHTCVQVRDHPRSGDISDCRELRDLEAAIASAPLNQTWTNDPGDQVSFFFGGAGFLASRLEVAAPDYPIGLGQPLQIHLKLSKEMIRYIGFKQWRYNGYGIGAPSVNSGTDRRSLDSGPAKIIEQGDGEATMEITPLALGELEVGVEVRYADGGFAQKFFVLRVVPSSRGLAKLSFSPMNLLFAPSDPNGSHETELSAEASYEGVAEPIRVYDMTGVHLTVEQPSNAPVVDVDAKGKIKALRAGLAVIVATFDGLGYRIPIHVY